ncbi:MAG: GGDEF domain-containing protein [Desulfovibrio sp.]|jgi:diguanylate cyclase (GGDEF)-like protein|nr:GGDEF domain-containing protein [Desulfovibrio sp.]
MIEFFASSLISIDIKSAIRILMWCNIVAALLVYCYILSNDFARETRITKYCFFSRILMGLGALLFLQRDVAPDLISVSLGNALFLLAFYFESLAMLTVAKANSRTNTRLALFTALLGIVVFNAVEFLYPQNPSLRVAVASICIFLTLLPPTVHMFMPPASIFRKSVGLFHVVYLCTLVPRVVLSLNMPTHLLQNNLVQSLNYLSLLIVTFFSLPAYLLLMKEDMDKMLVEMASADQLTGLLNRRGFFLSAEHIFRNHRHRRSHACVLFMDIDNFKKVNDAWGHAFGDEVLKIFARVTHSSLRTYDLRCRFGGEEFVVLLPRTRLADAEMIAQRIKDALSEIKFEEHPEYVLTASMGLYGGLPVADDTLDRFIEEADKAMYVAKQTGKNRIVAVTAEQRLAA